MSKSPAFQWYAADYLADERVMQLSLESEAAYVRLLNYCWREGSIPAKPEQCAPMCKYADVKVIKAALALFMKSPTQPGRLVHKRLEEERAKQEAFKLKQAGNGKLGGRPRKTTDNPDESQPKGLGFSGETQTEPKKRSSSSTSSSISSDDDSAGEPSSSAPLPALGAEQPEELAGRPAVGGDPQARTMALAHSDPADEQHWSVSPLVKPNPFRVICERLGHLGIDFEYYRRAALIAAQDGNISRTITQWTSWIRKFFEHQLRGGPLLKPTDGEATRTGVRAPQHPDGYRHEVRPELQAQRDAEEAERTAARIAANLARNQPGGVTTSPLATV